MTLPISAGGLRLCVPDETMIPELRAYREAFLREGGSMDGTASLRRFPEPADWLAYNFLCTHPASVPPHLVQQTQLVCVREADGRIVGMLQLRHKFNEFLEKYGGHIGYSVRPDERRKGYATWMLRSALPLCREVGIPRVLVTCLAENEGSRRAILRCGGAYESTVHEPERDADLERYWIDV